MALREVKLFKDSERRGQSETAEAAKSITRQPYRRRGRHKRHTKFTVQHTIFPNQ